LGFSFTVVTNHFSFQIFFEKGGLGYKVNYVSSFQFFTQIALKCIPMQLQKRALGKIKTGKITKSQLEQLFSLP